MFADMMYWWRGIPKTYFPFFCPVKVNCIEMFLEI
jgi:hypothetical protein